MSSDAGYIVHLHFTNNPLYKQHIFYIILTPEGDVTSSTHIRGSWVGLSEAYAACSCSMVTNGCSTIST